MYSDADVVLLNASSFMRIAFSFSTSTSAIIRLDPVWNLSFSARQSPFSQIEAAPAYTMSVEDSPRPAEAWM